MIEYRLVWNLHGVQMTESTPSPEDAAKTVVKRERFEGRRLEPEEYELLLLVRDGEGTKAKLWTDENHCRFDGYVELARRSILKD